MNHAILRKKCLEKPYKSNATQMIEVAIKTPHFHFSFFFFKFFFFFLFFFGWK
jgi:hypothetical protein